MNFNENTNFDTAGVAVFSLLDGTRGGLLGYKRVTTYTEAQAKYLPALIEKVDHLADLLWLNSGFITNRLTVHIKQCSRLFSIMKNGLTVKKVCSP